MTEPSPPTLRRVPTNGIALEVAEAGPEDGPLLLLLHGFPEFGYGWRHQVPALAAAGFRVVVPDQRGYAGSDKPPGVAAYDVDVLAADVLGLADHYRRERFAIAGHDWGAIVGWWTAQRHPGRVERLVALSAGHPAVWRERMERDPAQRRKSWYVKAFRVPWLPERLMAAGGHRALAGALRATARPGLVSDAELARYREAWRRPGALTAMVNWYRAFLAHDFGPASQYRVEVPTRMIWGLHDPYGDLALAEASVALCARGELVRLEGATHWVLIDEPERTSALLVEFLKGGAG